MQAEDRVEGDEEVVRRAAHAVHVALRGPHATADLESSTWGAGRELFSAFRGAVGSANIGATVFGDF